MAWIPNDSESQVFQTFIFFTLGADRTLETDTFFGSRHTLAAGVYRNLQFFVDSTPGLGGAENCQLRAAIYNVAGLKLNEINFTIDNTLATPALVTVPLANASGIPTPLIVTNPEDYFLVIGVNDFVGAFEVNSYGNIAFFGGVASVDLVFQFTQSTGALPANLPGGRVVGSDGFYMKIFG